MRFRADRMFVGAPWRCAAWRAVFQSRPGASEAILMLDTTVIACPYCGESIDILIDPSVEAQHYIEDCQVCCRPISIAVHIDDDGSASVSVSSEDEA
jgi:hypothetical protein